jgi:hypothetical protein
MISNPHHQMGVLMFTFDMFHVKQLELDRYLLLNVFYLPINFFFSYLPQVGICPRKRTASEKSTVS